MIFELQQDKNNQSLEKTLIHELPSYANCKSLVTEMADKKEEKRLKFIITKRGRKNKSQEIKKPERKNVHNKFSNDNIKRRIKASFNKYIIKLLNKLVKEKYKKARIKFLKMNIKITKDISIEYNRHLLNKYIKEIIVKMSNKYKNQENNKNCIKFIENKKENEEMINILNMTYEQLYINYLKSTKNDIQEYSYEAVKEKLLKLNGKKYLDKFIENAESFVEFFNKTKFRKSRNVKEIDNIYIPMENMEKEIQETTNISNELISNDNEDNNNSIKHYTSSSTQTDICDINYKIISFL